MILFDYECGKCGEVFERHVAAEDQAPQPCPKCGGQARRIISLGASNLLREDAPWIRSVLEVVAKDSSKPHTREFFSNPSRTNYKRWMKGEKLRPFEPGEERRTPQSEAMMNQKIVERLCKAHQERKRIEIRSSYDH